MRWSSLVLVLSSVALPSLVASCGDAPDVPAAADGGTTDSGQTDAGDALARALAACSADGVTEQALLSDLQARLSSLVDARRATWNAIFRLGPDGAVRPESVGPITWDPTHDSATLDSTDFERNVPILASNKAQNGAGSHKVLGMVGEAGTARYAAFGANLIHAVQASKAPDAGLSALAESTIAWLTRRADPKAQPMNVVVAHLPNQYYFPHEPSTRAWLAATYPKATLNSGYCESAKLDACAQGADLLVLSMDMGADNNHGVPYDGAAVEKAVASAQARGVPVLYLHYYRDPNDLGQRLLRSMRLSGTSNYWNIEQLAAFDPRAGAPASSDLGSLRAMVGTLATNSLSLSDYQSCLGKADHLADCAQAEWSDKLMAGASLVRTALGALDARGDSVCAGGRTLLEELVLLGDKVRTGDGATKPIAYPVDAWKDPAALSRAAFADHSVAYARATNVAQADLGSYTCAWSARLDKSCTGVGYDVSKVAVGEHTVAPELPAFASWTSTGVYALPGKPVTITRTDALGAGVEVRAFFGFQRAGSSHTLAQGKYTRPAFLQSPAVLLPVGVPITLSTPYGGPVYLQLSGDLSAAPAKVSVKLAQVARHPSVLDVGDAAQLAAFPADLAANPLPHVDLRAPGFEMHLRRDKVTSTIQSKYAGDTAAFLDDVRHRYVDQVYGLAGFKLPGVPLSQSLSADVLATCAHFGWACTDEALHTRKTVQHANFDEYATCGNGCSGNPFDADWAIDPIGWGESHELGHNLQMRALNVGHFAAGKQDDWGAWADRATENSNNVFPYHTLWNYQRNHKGNAGVVTDGHMNHKDLFAAVQSDLSGMTRTVNGVSRRVVVDSKCNRLGDYPVASANNRYEAIWQDGGYAANNGLRMSFYLQLPLIAHGQAMSGGTKLANGFDVLVLAYEHARLVQAAAKDATSWNAARSALGFGAFPFDGQASYAGGTVAAIPGNDFLLVSLSWITGRDFRPYFESRGVRSSALASKQIDAHIQAGKVTGAVDARLFALADELPGKDLAAAVRVPLDGVATWPTDGWHPSKCP